MPALRPLSALTAQALHSLASYESRKHHSRLERARITATAGISPFHFYCIHANNPRPFTTSHPSSPTDLPHGARNSRSSVLIQHHNNIQAKTTTSQHPPSSQAQAMCYQSSTHYSGCGCQRSHRKTIFCSTRCGKFQLLEETTRNRICVRHTIQLRSVCERIWMAVNRR